MKASDSRAAQYVNTAVCAAHRLLIEEGSDDVKACVCERERAASVKRTQTGCLLLLLPVSDVTDNSPTKAAALLYEA